MPEQPTHFCYPVTIRISGEVIKTCEVHGRTADEALANHRLGLGHFYGTDADNDWIIDDADDWLKVELVSVGEPVALPSCEPNLYDGEILALILAALEPHITAAVREYATQPDDYRKLYRVLRAAKQNRTIKITVPSPDELDAMLRDGHPLPTMSKRDTDAAAGNTQKGSDHE